MQNHKTILSRTQLVTRCKFNPENVQHRESLKSFLTIGRWGEIQFCAELPHVEVPATVLTKYALWCLNRELEETHV